MDDKRFYLNYDITNPYHMISIQGIGILVQKLKKLGYDINIPRTSLLAANRVRSLRILLFDYLECLGIKEFKTARDERVRGFWYQVIEYDETGDKNGEKGA